MVNYCMLRAPLQKQYPYSVFSSFIEKRNSSRMNNDSLSAGKIERKPKIMSWYLFKNVIHIIVVPGPQVEKSFTFSINDD